MSDVISCLEPPVLVQGETIQCTPLADRMKELKIPGVSIAVFHNGRLEWAQGFGVRAIGGAEVDAQTLFQAGSISKPVAAQAALRLVQQGKLSLDADVNSELTTWKVPASDAAHGKPVTLRELLTHTAGMSVHGFPGYAAGGPVPTLVQVLNGEKPANTAPIRVESEPGSTWRYSGGGYTVMQQMVIDATHEPFAKLLHDTVLAPIGMKHSTYEQPLPEEMRSDAATPHQADGTPVAGGAHTYPERAAAGLWTTPLDLVRYCMSVQKSLAGRWNPVLSQATTQEMLTAGKGNWGLGVQIGGSAADPYFSHGGVNEGFESEFVAYEHHGDGAVVMTNAQGGMRLVEQVMARIATVYDWPDLRPPVHAVVKVDHDTLAQYVGVYRLGPNFDLSVTLNGDQLETQATGQPQFPIFPESRTKFFAKDFPAELEFFVAANGQAAYAVLYQGDQQIKAVKK